MRFGEEDGRRESFTRQIRVLGGDLVETVAVRQARFENTALFALKSAKRIEAAIGAGCKTRTETGETLRAGLITAPACQRLARFSHKGPPWLITQAINKARRRRTNAKVIFAACGS